MREPGWFIRMWRKPEYWLEMQPGETGTVMICDLCVWGRLSKYPKACDKVEMLCPRCAKKRGLKW